MTLPDDLFETIIATESVLSDARDPWWIISSAAAALYGAHPINVADVDVIISIEDANRIFRRLAIQQLASSDHPRYRSASFGQWTPNPLTVEFMANFTLREADGVWRLMKPVTRQQVRVGGKSVYVPEITELRTMFERFGRPKDYERVELLNKLTG